MSNKVMTVLGGLIAGLAFLAGTMQGCGGGSSANPQDTCNKVCDKEDTCGLLLGFGLTLAQCKGFCTQSASGGASGSQGKCGNLTNEQAAAKFNQCLSMGCDMFQGCIGNVCSTTGGAGTSGGTGAGGTTGSAGTSGGAGRAGGAGTSGTGAGGASGGDCAVVCGKAETCCKALIPDAGASCSFVAGCSNTANAAQIAAACQNIVTAGAGMPACQ
jgi:hypothetical protein